MYKKYAQQYDDAVKSYYSSKELDFAYSKNVSKFYAYVNSKLNSLVGIPPLLNDDGTLAICDSKLLNKYFASVFTMDNGNNPYFPLHLQSTISLNSISFTYDKVLRTLKTLPNKCSITPDGFPSLFLKSIASLNIISTKLSVYYVYEKRTLTNCLEVGLVCPIFKKGARQLPCNYRPVSMTSICFKVMESIVSESMVHFLRVNGLI